MDLLETLDSNLIGRVWSERSGVFVDIFRGLIQQAKDRDDQQGDEEVS